jgi:RNA polymerase sigma-70 factor (ECF subfamily)
VATQDFDRIVKDFGAPLWRLTAVYARELADREDLYQEILVALWGALPRFRGEASVRTFVYRIGHNRGLTFRARSERRMRQEDPIPDAVPDPAPLPDRTLDRKEERERLTQAIAALSPTLAQPLLLHSEGLGYGEIASVLGITETNVGVRLNRARKELSRLLTHASEKRA